MTHPSSIQISNIKQNQVSNVYSTIYNDHVGKNTTSNYQFITESIRNVWILLNYVLMTTQNWINWKSPRVTITQPFYKKLVWFHIRIPFRGNLYVRVSNSSHPIKCTIKYCTKNPYQKVHHCIPAQSYAIIKFYILILFQIRRQFLRQTVTCAIKYSIRIVLHSTLLHSCTLHTPSLTSKYDLTIDSIELDNFLLGWIRNKCVQP